MDEVPGNRIREMEVRHCTVGLNRKWIRGTYMVCLDVKIKEKECGNYYLKFLKYTGQYLFRGNKIMKGLEEVGKMGWKGLEWMKFRQLGGSRSVGD